MTMNYLPINQLILWPNLEYPLNIQQYTVYPVVDIL